ncbi:hypothetical protein Taro_042624 [Colocasia esculenta]|uniref:CCHC-type domain-containing protein n=1 Tax=Colocasia esculenta TaxID=4460 RepID=A0A843WQ24_COLES|nr:hypothetical protein [Colocasia esculenta]
MEMWEKLRITYKGTDKVKETRIDILVTEYERFQMQSGETITQMFSRFTDITNGLAGLGKIYEMGDMVRKILRSLPSSWTPKVTAIEEAHDLKRMSLEKLIGSLMAHEINMERLGESSSRNKHTNALKAAEGNSEKKSEDEASSEDSEDEEAMLSRRLQRILAKKKRYQSGRRYSKKNKESKRIEGKDSKKGEPICYECKKPGHIKAECLKLKKPEFKKKDSSKKFRRYKKKAMAAAWSNSSDSDNESSSSSEEEEEANLAFMANTEEKGHQLKGQQGQLRIYQGQPGQWRLSLSRSKQKKKLLLQSPQLLHLLRHQPLLLHPHPPQHLQLLNLSNNLFPESSPLQPHFLHHPLHLLSLPHTFLHLLLFLRTLQPPHQLEPPPPLVLPLLDQLPYLLPPLIPFFILLLLPLSLLSFRRVLRLIVPILGPSKMSLRSARFPPRDHSLTLSEWFLIHHKDIWAPFIQKEIKMIRHFKMFNDYRYLHRLPEIQLGQFMQAIRALGPGGAHTEAVQVDFVTLQLPDSTFLPPLHSLMMDSSVGSIICEHFARVMGRIKVQKGYVVAFHRFLFREYHQGHVTADVLASALSECERLSPAD